MDIELFQQQPSSASNETLRELLVAWLSAGEFNHARIAVAYATVAGVRTLIDAFPKDTLYQSEWLIGLDDAITQPGAIDLLIEQKNTTVRVASYEHNSLRFHPKVFSFSGAAEKLTLIGSANLTKTAFSGNAEAVSIIRAKTESDQVKLDKFWNQIWQQGKILDPSALNAYRKRYEQAEHARKLIKKSIAKRPSAKKEILSSDEAELDPELAKICWIECGNITAMGRELEFKAEQGLFFGLSPSGGEPQIFKFKTTSGSLVQLRMKYQRNHMWRLQMNNEIPEVQTGLRPRLPNKTLGRSPYVAVFDRTQDKKVFKLSFLKLESKAFQELKTKSEKYGTVGRTTARSYGWC